jgi:glycerol-3-phosphate O-acyltransferase
MAKAARAKAAAELKSLARAHTEAAIAVLAAVMNDAAATPASRVRAAETLLDRGWGRTVQATEITGPESKELTFTVRFVAGSGSGSGPASGAGPGDDHGA